MDRTEDTLENKTFKSLFELKTRGIDTQGCSVGLVIAEYREAYRVKNLRGEFLARVTGKHMFEARDREDYPAVGDWVLIEEVDDEHAVLKKILERQSIIKRRFGDKNKIGEKGKLQIIATNIDVGFVVESCDRDYNLNRFERYFTLLHDGGVKGVIVLNKVDLLSEEEKKSILSELHSRFPTTDVIMTSTVTHDGLGELERYIQKEKVYCFLGSSGVGKSSLINTLLGEETIRTNTISSSAKRGKHTTTGRHMYFLDTGGIVIDNPGIREVGMTDAGEGIDDFFESITSLDGKCKYANCTHTHEPGCVVIHAIQKGDIDKETYANYVTLKKEVAYYEMSDTEKRQRGKDFGKFLHKAKKDLKHFKSKN